MNLNVLSSQLAASDSTATNAAELPLDDAGLPSGFAQLLSERFAPDSQGKEKLTAAQLQANDQQTPAFNRQQLNQLLASLSEHGRLPADPLAPGNLGDSKSPLANRDGEQPLQPLDMLDAATLQALFAMLPASVVQPLQGNGLTTTTEQNGDESDLTVASTLLTTLGEKAELTATDLATQKTQSNVNEKATLTAKTAPAVTLPIQGESHEDNTTTPMKLAVEAGQSSPALQHSVPTPVSSPTLAPLPTSATVNAPATPLLNAQLGSPEWQQALGQQVLMFHRNGQQSAELRLHPQELGALQITLKLDDNQAQLHIASAHSQVRAAVEATLPHLRHALAENGINLGQSSVGGESLPQSQHSEQQASHNGTQPSYREQHGSAESDMETLSAPAALQAMARSVDGVDIFA